MMNYALEFLNLCNLTDYLKFKINVVSKRLSLNQFSPQTIFINSLNQIDMPGSLLELNIESAIKTDLPKKCYLPNIPIFNHKSIVPEDYREKGIPIANFNSVTSSSSEKFPAIIEFSEDRFVVNFDIYKTINFIRREMYFTKKRPSYTYSPINIQKIPAKLRQIVALRYLKAGKNGNVQPLFPSYPKDYSVEILINLFLYCIQKVIKRDVILSIWPKNKKYAFILTHDLDSNWIYQSENLNTFLEVEKQFGIRGAWFFVTNLYKHDFKKIDLLINEGHEIAFHDYNHDHKIAFLSEKDMHRRLSKCRWFIDKYQVLGFRSPHYLRTPTLYEVLKHYVKYDTSMHDSYNPTSKVDLVREGCSTVYPFKLSESEDSLLELPITIPEDFELYDPKKGPISIIEPQLEQIEEVKERGGLATLVIHPEAHLSAKKHFFEAFKEILCAISADSECWICQPKDIYYYWLDRKIL